MPDNARYMSEASDLLSKRLPSHGKYILDKTLTGCGGTEFFINSGRPLVLVSPRTGVLLDKSQQHPECHLFRDNPKCDIQALKDNLRRYLDRPVNIFGPNPSSIILVTLDSCKYVIEELKHRKIIDRFLFLNDEFQCLIGDAAFKGDVDLEFLRMLDREAKNICHMSATPIDDTYLNALPEFQNTDYYKLKWDPNVIVEPTVKEIMMGEGESAQSILKGIISDYRRYGYFAGKIVDGVYVEAKEVVVFVNEVRTILNIIKENRLSPNEVTVLVSSSNKYVSELKKMGFQIGSQNPDKANPRNTTFTFCSKASFEGRDFYSTSAFTYIFLDGTKDWEIHDTSIEIPQMLGRQRLDANPFRYNAVIYYRTKPNDTSMAEYMSMIRDKLNASRTLVDSYNSGIATLKKSLVDLVKGQDPSNRYQSNYLDVVDNAGGQYSLEINYLVAASEHNLAINKTQFYNNPLFLTTAIQNQIASCNTKPQELRDFEKQFNDARTFGDRMGLYCSILNLHPEYEQALLANPFIEQKFHYFYLQLGPAAICRFSYEESAIEWELCRREIILRCQNRFLQGQEYTLTEVKTGLQEIYDNLGIGMTAKATDLFGYLPVKQVQRTLQDGSRPRMLKIL